MSTTPLHPAVVHIPLGLSFVIPLLAIILTLRFWRQDVSRFVWGLIVLLQTLVLGAGLIALKTGEAEEHRVKKLVAERPIEVHEERGRILLMGGAVALTLSLLVLILPGKMARWGMLAATAMSVAAAVAAFEAGHSGGELVYVHGAAAPSSGPSSSVIAEEEEVHEH